MQDIQEKPNEKGFDMQTSWFVVWMKKWNISNWLMSSFISSLILFEIHTVILSVYPNFMISIWLSLGIQSLVLSSIMTCLSIISLGLLSGAIIYSAHLALTSMDNFEKIYLPLIETWSNNAKRFGPILVNLLDDPSFLKITQTLKDYPAAQPLVEFLKNDENAESVQKIIQLLKDIWSQDSINMQVKTLVIHLLSQYVQKDNAKQHIDNIWVLWQFLQKNEELNIDTIIQVLQNSTHVQALIGQIETFKNDPEMLKRVISKPEILAYLPAMNKAFSQKTLVEQANILHQLCDDDNTPLISCSLFSNIQQLDEAEQNQRITLLDGIMHHPQSKQIGQLLQAIHTQNPAFCTHVKNTTHLINLFQGKPHEDLNLSKLSSVVTMLDKYQCFHLMQTKHLSQLDWIDDLLQTYAHAQPIASEHHLANIEKILLVQNEQDKKDCLKALHTKDLGEKKKNTRYLPKASSIIKIFQYPKNKAFFQEKRPTDEKNPPTAMPLHEEKYRLFVEKKQLESKEIDNHLRLNAR